MAPSVSPAEHRAMEAAAHGKSNLGIPKKVGEEFVRADKKAADELAPNAAIPAGVRRKQAFDAELRTLYVNRPLKNADAVLAWAKEAGFTKTLPPGDMHVTIAFSKEPIDWNAAPDGFDTEIVPASKDQKDGARSVEKLGAEGAVVLRFESTDLASRWQQFRRAGASWDHDGFKPHVTITYDAGDVDLSKVVPYDGPLEFGEEIFAEVDTGWADKVKKNLQATDSAILALDKDSVRSFDRDGRMRVAIANISKEQIRPYRGIEIPGWDNEKKVHALGLDPDEIYNLYCPGEELEKAAATFNGIQLLRKHTPVNADDHKKNDIVGTTGTEAKFRAPFLQNSLVIWTKEGIDFIESEDQKELSCGYHYVPVMTPGTFKGEAFHGRMTELAGNHVTLVGDGRAGPECQVEDSAVELQWAAIERAVMGMVA
ncbi:DUF2213 domain-containing protein [Bradyrhizobium sp.]